MLEELLEVAGRWGVLNLDSPCFLGWGMRELPCGIELG